MSATEPSTGAGIGRKAPDFKVKDGAGKTWSLSDHKGKTVALVFYPKDETAVCTRQMCSMRDRWDDYEATGAEVVAISVGSVDSHKAFEEHYGLPQRLLADKEAEVTRLYNVESFFGGSQRAVIVIDSNGIVRSRSSVAPLSRPTDD